MAIALEVSRRRADVESYVVYEKLEANPPAGTLRHVYTGRTWGRGNPAQVLARRDALHLVQRPNFLPAIVNASVTTIGFSDAAYGAMRGREQTLMDWHDLHEQPTIYGYNWSFSHSENARPTLTRAHGTRGVAQSNPRAFSYHVIAEQAYGHIWEFTGAVSVITDVYYWPPLNIVGSSFSRIPLPY